MIIYLSLIKLPYWDALWDEMRWCPGTTPAHRAPVINRLARLQRGVGLERGCRPAAGLRLPLLSRVRHVLIWQSTLLLEAFTRGTGLAGLLTTSRGSCTELCYLVRWAHRVLVGIEHSRRRAGGGPETQAIPYPFVHYGWEGQLVFI